MHILDTDTLTHLYAGHQGVIYHLKNLKERLAFRFPPGINIELIVGNVKGV